MHEGIYIAASGGLKQSKKMEVIANNLANVNSTGYKRDRLAFKELLDPFAQKSGLDEKNDKIIDPTKTNKNVSYVGVTEQYTDHKPGIYKQTNSEFDLALDGPGFFSISTNEGIRYTRNGNFRLDTDNQLVNQKGQTILSDKGDPIVINAKGSNISIDAEGNIYTGTGQANTNIGKIKIIDFENKQNLEKLGDGLFYQSNSDEEIKQIKNTKVRQGFLEGSNVTAVDEMTNMISTLRLFETYQKMIQSIDSMDDQSVNNIGRVG